MSYSKKMLASDIETMSNFAKRIGRPGLADDLQKIAAMANRERELVELSILGDPDRTITGSLSSN